MATAKALTFPRPARAGLALAACLALLGCGAERGKQASLDDAAIHAPDTPIPSANDPDPNADGPNADDQNADQPPAERDRQTARQPDGGERDAAATPDAASGTVADAGTSEATLDTRSLLSCQVYCERDADCCAESGLGAGCPGRFPDRVICRIDLALGWDHMCHRLNGACAEDQECKDQNPRLACRTDAPQWCAQTLCPGLGTCIDPGCASDDECPADKTCVIQGGVGSCMRACTRHTECAPLEECREMLFPGASGGLCVGQPNVWPPQTPPVRECTTDADCARSDKGPRCHEVIGRCGCGDDSDCAANERCRQARG